MQELSCESPCFVHSISRIFDVQVSFLRAEVRFWISTTLRAFDCRLDRNSVQHHVAHFTTPVIWFREAGKQDSALVPSGKSRLSCTIAQLGKHRVERGLGILALIDTSERQAYFSSTSCLAVNHTTRPFLPYFSPIFFCHLCTECGDENWRVPSFELPPNDSFQTR